MKLLIKDIFYFSLFFLFVFLVGFYAYYKYKMPPNQPYINDELYKFYPKDIILKTGRRLNLPPQRFQHFLNFPVKKKKGTIRIGAFGDSHTYGSEVEKTATYPYYLQKLFNKKFPDHSIEALNFGVGATGFPEQFFLWKKYAKTYQLDYILLGPVGFYSERNTRFTYKNMKYRPPHNRFILDEDRQLTEVHIKGDSIQKRFKNYYSLIPSWTALRYDKQPFKIYEILFPFLRYKIKNPFYYTRMSEDEEAVKINRRLIEKINKVYPKKILFFTHEKSLYQLYKTYNNLSNKSSGNLYNLNFIPIPKLFYKVFAHRSSLGNELTAQLYFNALLGKKHFFLNIIQCHLSSSELLSNSIHRMGKDDESIDLNFETEPIVSERISSQKDVLEKVRGREKKRLKSHNLKNVIDLDSVNRIEVLGQDTFLFNLRVNRSDHYWNHGTYKNYKKEGTKSFFAFLKKDNFLKSVYIPLPFQLKKGMKLYIQFKNKSRVELGSIQALDNYNKFFALYSDHIIGKIDYSHTHWFIYLKDLNIEEGELFIDDYKLGRVANEQLYGKKLLKFIPNIGYQNTFLMMGPQDSVQERDFPNEFPVFINYQTKEGKNFKSLIPDWTCRKEKQEINLDLPHFEPLILSSNT